jgi:hypothetical protein
MVAQGCKFVFAKLLREPVLRWKKDPITKLKVPVVRSWGNKTGTQLYSSVRCEVKTKTTIEPPYYPGGKPRKYVEYDNTLENYNDEKYIDLNFRDIWLIEE